MLRRYRSEENKYYADDRKCPAGETAGSMEHTIRGGCAKGVGKTRNEDCQAPLQCGQDALMLKVVLNRITRATVIRYTRRVHASGIYLPPSGCASARVWYYWVDSYLREHDYHSSRQMVSYLHCIMPSRWRDNGGAPKNVPYYHAICWTVIPFSSAAPVFIFECNRL